MVRSSGVLEPRRLAEPSGVQWDESLAVPSQSRLGDFKMQICEALAPFLAGYFSTCKLSAKTQAAYGIDLLQLKKHVGETTLLPEIGPEVMEGWAAHLQNNKYAAVSIRRKFATARVFFSYWVRRAPWTRAPCGGSG